MLLGQRRPDKPLHVVRAKPVLVLYTDVNGNTKWRRVSPIEIKWTSGDEDTARPEPGYVIRVFDHDQHKMCSFVPERIHKWEQEK